MEHELQDFLHHCGVERRLARKACSAHERDVRACIRFLEERQIVQEVRLPDLRAFLVEESVRRPAPSSQSRTIAALKNFFRFLFHNEYLERDPAAGLLTPKKRLVLPDILDQRELALLFGAVDDPRTWKHNFRGKRERDRLMLGVMAFAGLRKSEVLGLDWDDLDFERRLLRVRQGKGGRQRVVPVHRRSSRSSLTT